MGEGPKVNLDRGMEANGSGRDTVVVDMLMIDMFEDISEVLD